MRTPKHNIFKKENERQNDPDKKEEKLHTNILKNGNDRKSSRQINGEEKDAPRGNAPPKYQFHFASKGLQETAIVDFLGLKDELTKATSYESQRKKMYIEGEEGWLNSQSLLPGKIGHLGPPDYMSQIIEFAIRRERASELMSRILSGVKQVLPKALGDLDWGDLHKVMHRLQRKMTEVYQRDVGDEAAKRKEVNLKNGYSFYQGRGQLCFSGTNFGSLPGRFDLFNQTLDSTKCSSDEDSDQEEMNRYFLARNDSQAENVNEVIDKRYSLDGAKKSRDRKNSKLLRSSRQSRGSRRSEPRPSSLQFTCIAINSDTKVIVVDSGAGALPLLLVGEKHDVYNVKHHSQDPQDFLEASLENAGIDKNSGRQRVRKDSLHDLGRKLRIEPQDGKEEETLKNDDSGTDLQGKIMIHVLEDMQQEIERLSQESQMHSPEMRFVFDPLFKLAFQSIQPSAARRAHSETSSEDSESSESEDGTDTEQRTLHKEMPEIRQVPRDDVTASASSIGAASLDPASEHRISETSTSMPRIEEYRVPQTEQAPLETDDSGEAESVESDHEAQCDEDPSPAAASDYRERSEQATSGGAKKEAEENSATQNSEPAGFFEEEILMEEGQMLVKEAHSVCQQTCIIAQPQTESEMSDMSDSFSGEENDLTTDCPQAPAPITAAAGASSRNPPPSPSQSALDSSSDDDTTIRMITPVQASSPVTTEIFSEFSEFGFDDLSEISRFISSFHADLSQTTTHPLSQETRQASGSPAFGGEQASAQTEEMRPTLSDEEVLSDIHSVRSQRITENRPVFPTAMEAASVEELPHWQGHGAFQSIPFSVQTTHPSGHSEAASRPGPAHTQLPPITVHTAGSVPPWAAETPRLDLSQAASRDHANLLTRRATYHRGWPENSGQDPAMLALAGWYYTGPGRRLRCWWCGVYLNDLHPGDDPWEEHALRSPSCRYLLEMRSEEFFVRTQGCSAKEQ
ncbi:hypothetical protein BaRGS_00005601 [Batillaria attramentaria]|uniref:Uncharacterized protein n=1 Tax=Batillaria attramentaria TaxID=370345 RepID=A0ABD0LTX2_9CAEN